GATSAPSFWSVRSTKRCRSSTRSRPSTSRLRAKTPNVWPATSAMPARFSSARTPPRQSAITSPAPTMCCRPRARPASPPGWVRFKERQGAPEGGPGQVPRVGPRGDRAGRSGGTGGARPLGDDAPHPAMTRPPRASDRKKNRLVAVTLDEASIGRSNPDVEHERAGAIYGLLEDNTFAPHDEAPGPFALQ